MHETSDAPAGDGPDAARGERVAAQVRRWVGDLIDLGGRNNLLFHRDLRRGTLDLAAADPQALAQLRQGREVRLSRLVSAESLPDALVRARTIRRRAQEHFEERGLRTLHLAQGICTWTPRGPGPGPAAPVLLTCLAMEPVGAAQEDFTLRLVGDAEVNPTLLHALRTEHGCDPDLDALAERLDGAVDTPEEVEEVLRWLVASAAEVPGLGVAPRHVVGTFSYAKLPMVRDLEGAADALAAHPIVAALAGDEAAREELRALERTGDVDPAQPDRTAPQDEFLVLDADASQSHVVNAVAAGRNLIVKGPPGTGKSQTIANLVATLVARGQRVLFVAEKRAAIDAVLGRLERLDLGDLVLDLHGMATRRSTAQALGAALERAGRTPAVVRETADGELVRRRADLTRYEAARHAPRAPWGVSVHDAQVACAGTPPRARIDARLAGDALSALDDAALAEAADALRAYVGLGGPALVTDRSPWGRTAVTTADEAERALALVQRLERDLLPAARTAMTDVAAATGHRPPGTVGEWPARAACYVAVSRTLATLGPAALGPDGEELLARLAPLGRRGPTRTLAALASRDFRAARRELAALGVREGDDEATRHRALVAGREQAAAWAAIPAVGATGDIGPARAEALAEAVDALAAGLAELEAVLPGAGLSALGPEGLGTTLTALRRDRDILARLPELLRLRARLTELGLDGVVADCAARDLDADLAVAALRHARLASIAEHVSVTDVDIAAFDGDLHRRTVAQFRAADRDHIGATAARVSRAAAERIVAARERWPDQGALVARQAALKRGHLPLRRLVAEAPDMLLALKPCWATSPLMVSQVLPSDAPLFDVVVFDEASQVLPADAVPAIIRGRRLVVAGDPRQLPPTTFFAAQTREEEDADPDELLAGTAGYESILEALAPLLPSRTLRWHYRSEDERLIAFSNVHLYDRTLTTFPGVGRDGEPVRHELVPRAPGEVDERSAGAEVRRAVELALAHARSHPDESLGVIAMGITHAERIAEALRRALADAPELGDFFDETHPEPAFVKNLERVQGDERDAIIISVGYGWDAQGRLPHRFGPLNQEGGERRLNVAVTRARRRLTLVSSFSADDMDPDRSRAAGVDLLRRYLRYARTGGGSLAEEAGAVPPLNPFEVDVRDALTAAGLSLDAQFGCSGYRIDFAVRHPEHPGRHVLAIECDGASYHSAATARDRDRLRQEHLERLGWRFHRIWSQEWRADRDRAVEEALSAYRAALAADASEPARPAPAGRPAPAPPPPPPTPARGPAPAWIRPGAPIQTYRRRELAELVAWIGSDTLLRTDDELVRDAMAALGYTRRGSRIVAALERAIADARPDAA